MDTTITWFGSQLNSPKVVRLDSGSPTSTLMTSPETRRAFAWQACVAAVRAIRRYQDDWDGLGAKAPDPELADSVENLLSVMRERNPNLVPSRVAAAPDSSIVVEWQIASTVMEAEVNAVGIAEFMLSVPGHKPEHWTLKFTQDNPDDQSRRVSGWVSATA